MKYINAKTLLPEALVEELQNYIQAGYIYVPAKEEQHRSWGEAMKRYGRNTDKAFPWRNFPAAIAFPYPLYEKSFTINNMDRRRKNTKMRRSFYTKHFGIIL